MIPESSNKVDALLCACGIEFWWDLEDCLAHTRSIRREKVFESAVIDSVRRTPNRVLGDGFNADAYW